MQQETLRRELALLESKVDMMEAELFYLNNLLTRCGFPEGIRTLKNTVEEILSEQPDGDFPEATSENTENG